jgi:hypothetical protein
VKITKEVRMIINPPNENNFENFLRFNKSKYIDEKARPIKK